MTSRLILEQKFGLLCILSQTLFLPKPYHDMNNGGCSMKSKKKKSATILIFLGIFVILLAALVLVNRQSKKQMDSVENVYGIPASKLTSASRELLDDPNYQQIILPDDMKAKIDN